MRRVEWICQFCLGRLSEFCFIKNTFSHWKKIIPRTLEHLQWSLSQTSGILMCCIFFGTASITPLISIRSPSIFTVSKLPTEVAGVAHRQRFGGETLCLPDLSSPPGEFLRHFEDWVSRAQPLLLLLIHRPNENSSDLRNSDIFVEFVVRVFLKMWEFFWL